METEKKVYKSSEAQRAANRRYREKVKDTEEYKQKNLAWVKKYTMNNYEKSKVIKGNINAMIIRRRNCRLQMICQFFYPL